MTLTVHIRVPEGAGNHEAKITCSTDGYKNETILACGDEVTVHVHSANEVHIAEVPAGTKAKLLQERYSAVDRGNTPQIQRQSEFGQLE